MIEVRLGSEVTFRLRLVHWRARWLRVPSGEQALFLRRSTYDAAGGFAPVAAMEDVDLVYRLRPRAVVVCRESVLVCALNCTWHGCSQSRSYISEPFAAPAHYASDGSWSQRH